jgi:protein ImuB
VGQPAEADLAAAALERPRTIYACPAVLEVVAVAPDGPPASFRLRGRTHKIVRHSGPERIETGWWRGPSVRRDYYRVETAASQRFWLFRDLHDGTWCLHGEFS